METETGNGFIADKEARVGSSGGESDMKLQRTDSFPYKMMMKKMIHLHNLNRPFESSETENGGGGGPTFYNEGCDIYDVVGGGGGTVARTLQPFNTTAFKSPGGMAASLMFPFTSAQWQELERQALIYKYMMAAVPVPPDLLMPICRNLSDSVPSHSNLARSACFNLRFSSSSDPEPGRCRRTDGKKWRCSRDVAPDQKYCERHMHRGRPRSRKPVELHADINNINRNNTHSALPATPASACFSGITANTSRTSFRHPGASKPYQQPSRLLAEPDYKASPFESMVPPSPYKEPRCVDWTMKGETVPLAASIQQWPQQMRSKVGFRTDINNCNSNASLFQQYYEEPLNLNSYSNFGPGEGSEANQQNDQCFMFLNPELASLEDPPSPEQRQSPRGFIDAWSTVGRDSTTDTVNKSCVPSNRKLSLSCLTLSMSGGAAANEDTEKIQMGLGLIDSERDNGGDAKTHPLNWMNPISWMPSPPGGPLAEVLRPSTAATAEATGTNAASSHGCCGTSSQKSPSGSGGLNLMTSGWGGSGDAGSPRTTTASSPSDVLQKTLASLSDSSGSSSPRFTAGAAKSEIAIQWLNQSNLPSST